MVWTDTTRSHYERKTGRYASDCTDEEWRLISPFIPEQSSQGRPRTTNMREVWNAVQYMNVTGCQWRMLSKDFPPMSTVQGYFYNWSRQGLFHRINHALVMTTREKEGREVQPTAGVIDSQSVKTTESGGICGYDGPSRRRFACLSGNGQKD